MSDNVEPLSDLPEPPTTPAPERGAEEPPWPAMDEGSPTLSTDSSPADPEAGSSS